MSAFAKMFGGKTRQGVTDTTNESAGLVKDFRNTTCRLPPTIKKDEVHGDKEADETKVKDH
ncbi:hypothetical protein Pmar_PMAR006063 [Perkinsus marinus ATCC 50983]|uniref:Uncharacterized protein n=1 Tax=Perkinsus marinus (strain ATCC 50983 / TXsc) TaxID=423536 RepID=C5LA42_PERM5|nr:hypothetical protein Pmar_PMAR006063 [Perkinsus marinus ATCC 50983]EER06298.1 hypothetical protein Pmar_PMAR006063 [Perkinsus marinus ATCC 50983]|eukprot:XP_002774482.1 hypothetical protein Pmar_PMAR006063 [Perkinsus marinus ATCC 50983]